MKPLDQCPSTAGKTSEKRELAGTSTGRSYWRSVEEYADSDGFREFVDREFPAGASELLTSSRRGFMKLMGASMALAGAATIPGCRRPDHKIMPYSADVPEDVIPGKPIYYATAMPLPGGGAEGLIVETHQNRPTKIEGNPLHSVNQGRSSVLAQASILGLYDTDRLTDPKTTIGDEPGKPRSWEEFGQWQASHFAKYDNDGGAGLAFVVDKKTSPSRNAAKAMVQSRWPKATWVAYDAAGTDSEAAGAGIAFGQPMRAVQDFSKAQRVLALSSDFLCQGAGHVAHARAFAAGRRVSKSHDEMSRLYAVETTFSNTGAMADHRLALSPSDIESYIVALAKKIIDDLAAQGETSLGQLASAIVGDETLTMTDERRDHWIDAVAADLIAHRGQSVIVAGNSLSAQVHALVIALNSALGNLGTTIKYIAMTAEEASSSPDRLAALADRLRSKQVTTVVAIEVNPVFDAPADLEFGALYAAAETTVCLSSSRNETSAASTWALPGTHFLEAWGDAEAYDGSVSVIQPMIAPLYGGKSEIELLALLADEVFDGGQSIVKQVWSSALGSIGFEKKWKRALHDGIIRPATSGTVPALLNASVADALNNMATVGAKAVGTFEVLFMPSFLYDGRFANNGWLQELPHAATRVAWDNPALISPATAERLEIMPDPYTKKMPKAKMVRLQVGERAMEIPVWIMPGIPDDTVILQFGYGRTNCGRVGGDDSKGIDWQVGFNTFEIRSTGTGLAASGAKLSKVPGEYLIASTQNHWSMESRTTIVRQIDKKYWDIHAEEFEHLTDGRLDHKDTGYGTTSKLNLAEKMGESGHGPPNISIYDNPRNQSKADAEEGSRYAQGQQWGMTIDLSTCTGCGTCTVACQAENNIPIVGKKETAKGREMQWIRVDRYYFNEADGSGNDWKNPGGMAYQPMACVHCENAPCETVCPVNATTHGPEGMNYMVYNRCIGTRYCANNCPYKVRRFNFFDYGVKAFNGDYIGQGLTKRPDNVNFIPPRLREKLPEIEKLQKNPDVTVRSRGVMEKCTYCVQRVNEARIEAKLRGMKKPGTNEVLIPDGFFQVACQQACPSEAITFGDIRDENSAVYKEREGQRAYLLLGYLDTRPRTSHMIRVDNPNEAMISQARIEHDPLGHDGGGEEEGGGDGHEAETEGSHAFFDKSKTSEDTGYALSLRVLGLSNGIHA